MNAHVELYLFHLFTTNQHYYCPEWFMERMAEFNMLMEDLFQASYDIPDDGLPF